MDRTHATIGETGAGKARKKPKKYSQTREVWRWLKKNKTAMAALYVIILLLLIVIFADVIVSYDLAIKQNPMEKLAPPSMKHYFGTDFLGRDLFARIIHGSRISLLMGFGATGIAVVIATLLGASSAFIGGWFDGILMRVCDMIITIPAILLAIAITAAFGIGVPQLIFAIAVPQTVIFTRVYRSAVLGITGEEYIEAARAIGINNFNIIIHHIIPNVFGFILVQGTMAVAANILLGAMLSFLGLGAPIPIPEWGMIMSEGLRYVRYSTHTVYITTFFLAITALSINIFGDGLRDAFDPRLKGKS